MSEAAIAEGPRLTLPTGVETRAAALPYLPEKALPAGLLARVWIEARCFFSREDAQSLCWLWLLRADGRVQALRMEAGNRERDDLLPLLLARLETCSGKAFFNDSTLGRVRVLSRAPVVPLPRWAVSWGHPVQQAIRAFATALDDEVLAALGRLEVPGPFFGSVENYNRLAALPQPVRGHRLQALERFPPLVAPLLLDLAERPDMFNEDDIPSFLKRRDAEHCVPALEAMDCGRDLIGALAAHYRIDRALVRSPLFREPWTGGYAPRSLLRLLSEIPAHARPREHNAVESRLPCLEALPVRRRSSRDVARLARVFAPGWDTVWQMLETRFRPLVPALRDSRDFLRSAWGQAELPPELDRLFCIEMLGLAWLVRRDAASLLEASRRWHAQPVVNDRPGPDCSLPDTVPAILPEQTLPEGHVREIATRQALIDEGETMHHCVGDYWPECVIRATRIVHLETRDGEVATAQYDVDKNVDLPRFNLADLRGSCNVEPSRPMRQLAEEVAALMNSPAHAERRREALRESVAARESYAETTADFIVRRQPLRPLDNRSRRELRLVLAWCRKQEDWCSRPDELFRGAIAGFRYAEGPRLLDRLDAGDPLQLVREPYNPHDPLAVRVDWNGHKLGYVSRPDNAPIARRLDAGVVLTATILAVRIEDDAWSPLEFTITPESAKGEGEASP